MTSSLPTSNSSRSPTHRGQPYLTYEDLHARFSPPHSPPLRMPRVQRSLSADDLLQRFRHGPHREMQVQNPPAITVPSPPPAVPPDLEALRPNQSHRPLSPHSADRLINQTTRLSTKLPDPPVFSGNISHVPFDDWKLRIQDKLTHNSDHYPCESFKVAYVMTRLGGEASKHITLKRRKKSLSNSDLSSKELLDQLSDLYETPLSVIYEENRHALNHLKQGTKQLFFDFYTKWVRYSERGYAVDAVDEEMQVWDLEDRLKEQLRTPLASQLADCRNQSWTIPDLKVYLMRLDQSQRIAAERLAHEKAQAFAAQYSRAKAEAETKHRRSGQQIKILSRSDSGYELGGDPAYWR